MNNIDSNFLSSEHLWRAVEPLLPEEPPKPKGGRPRMPALVSIGHLRWSLSIIAWQNTRFLLGLEEFIFFYLLVLAPDVEK